MKLNTYQIESIFDSFIKLGGLFKIFGIISIIFSPLFYIFFYKKLSKEFLINN